MFRSTIRVFFVGLMLVAMFVAGTLRASAQEGPIALSISDLSQAEGNGGTAVVRFRVSLSRASREQVRVKLQQADGTARAGSDYVVYDSPRLITFAPGSTIQLVSMLVQNDTMHEDQESMFVSLIEPEGATVADGQAELTIDDNDPVPTLSVADAEKTEGNANASAGLLVARLSNPTEDTVRVTIATTDESATAGQDYNGRSGVLTILPGRTFKAIVIPVLGDVTQEGDETLQVNLSQVLNATLEDTAATLTISNDDPTPSMSVADVSVFEGESGTTEGQFKVRLSNPSAEVVRVNWATADQTAVAGTDYASTTGTLEIPAGQREGIITFTVNGDTLHEANEVLLLNLSGVEGATLVDGQARGTIVNDDAAPTVRIGNVVQAEGDAGTTSFAFEVRLSAPSGRTLAAFYAVAANTATAGEDFTPPSSSRPRVIFQPGQVSKTITVPVIGDRVREGDEAFVVKLTGASVPIADDAGLGVIRNDDPLPSLTIDNVQVTEGNSNFRLARFTVTASSSSDEDITFQYATADGSATAGSDYNAASGSKTIPAGQASITVNVVIISDGRRENVETFFVRLSNAVNATLADAEGAGAILDDDPNLSIADVSLAEGNGTARVASLTVTMSDQSSQDVTVNWTTVNDTATAGSDYGASSGTLTIPAGQTTGRIRIVVRSDTVVEPDERFKVELSFPTNASLRDARALVTITNDD